MADTKITALTALTAADPANDVIPIVDVSDTTMAASGTTKKISVNNILSSSPTASGALTVTGLVTAGSATITGDLTVDTSTLKVNSTTDRVGIGTVSPGKRCEINQSANAITTIGAGEILRLIGDDGNVVSRITEVGFGSGPTGATFAPVVIGAVNTSISGFGTKDFYVATRVGIADVAPLERYRIDSTGVATWSNVGGVAGTAMTLNANGLGIGVNPVTSHNLSSAGPIAISGTNSGTRTSYISNSGSCSIYYTDGGGSGFFADFGNLIIQPRTSAARNVVIATGSTTPVERAVVKSTGQVRFVPLAADPSGAEAGDVYYNSTSNKLKCYNGTTWNDLF